MLRINLDHDLENADWPKRTPVKRGAIRESSITETFYDTSPDDEELDNIDLAALEAALDNCNTIQEARAMARGLYR